MLPLALSLTVGCAHWSTEKVKGASHEVSRRALGAPQVAETTEMGGSVGGAGATASNGGSTVGAGVLSGSFGSTKRTHCIQQFEINYEQAFEMVPDVSGRGGDIAGAAISGGLGLLVLASDAENQNNGSGPPSTTGFLAGGALISVGAAWLGYSIFSLPKGPPPASVPGKTPWSETKFVESTGCASGVGGPAARPAVGPPAAPTRAVEERLLQLETLRKNSLITEEEYQERRVILPDQL
ncbi:MAG: hypothetical protein GY811_11300 [Myxococcales bacterium]|nr:hypothetical protein [Myxococcales bacterium]